MSFNQFKFTWKAIILIFRINGVASEKTSKKADKKISKKTQKEQLKAQKEIEMKDSILREERARLHSEAMRTHNVN